jgi:ABC-type amino acid transport substrate-binding protein
LPAYSSFSVSLQRPRSRAEETATLSDQDLEVIECVLRSSCGEGRYPTGNFDFLTTTPLPTAPSEWKSQDFPDELHQRISDLPVHFHRHEGCLALSLTRRRESAGDRTRLMAHEVFISYCSEDKNIADAVCVGLEAEKIACWIAPRDVAPGANYGAAIIDAITETRIMVVIFSSRTNQSRHVSNEIERAVSNGDTVIPFRIEDVLPSKDIEFFISSCHWLDAITPPVEAHVAKLATAVKAILGRPSEEPREDKTRTPVIRSRRPRARWMAVAAGAVSLLLLAGLLTWWALTPAADDPQVTPNLPENDAHLAGPLILSWGGKNLDKTNLEFEVQITPEGKPALSQRVARYWDTPEGFEGPARWRVRPIWQQQNGKEKYGRWSEQRTFTYYRSALDRILATRTIHVGTAEADVLFVRKEGGEFTGFEIEFLRRIGNGLLEAHGIPGEIKIQHSYRVWGEELFQLLSKEGEVDLLVSGISIVPERETKYGLKFTKPILEFPQTLITVSGKKPFEGGQLLLTQLAAVANTTNETLARRLLGPAFSDRLRLYSGSGAYNIMLNDLLAEVIDGALMDRPYAIQKVEEFTRERQGKFSTLDITSEILPGVEPERTGFAVRRSDFLLLGEINTQLDKLKDVKRELIRQYLPNPESYLGSEASADS